MPETPKDEMKKYGSAFYGCVKKHVKDERVRRLVKHQIQTALGYANGAVEREDVTEV